MLEKPKKVYSSAYVHNYMGLGFLDQLEQQYLSIIFFFLSTILASAFFQKLLT